MKASHLAPRRPADARVFSWGRSLRGALVLYRLFRRDRRGVWRMEAHAFAPGTGRRTIAAQVRELRARLRERLREDRAA